MFTDMTLTTLSLYRCCDAVSEIPATCTYPQIQGSDADGESICPAPPRVSYDDVASGATGKLDSYLTFVDEYLLHRAEDLEPNVYKRRLMGGFVLSYIEPDFGTCGLPDPMLNENTVNDSFLLCRDIPRTDYYTLNTAQYQPLITKTNGIWLNDTNNCPVLIADSSGLYNDSLIDGFSAYIVQRGFCNNASKDRPPAMYTGNFTEEMAGKMAATVYYSNEVSSAYLFSTCI